MCYVLSMDKLEILITSVFERSLKKLVKKYPSLKNVYKNVINDLETTPGIGDEIQGHQFFYKVRYPNIDAKKGKSGGFRVIYYWPEKGKIIILVSIYSKTQQQEVKWHIIKKAMEELKNGQS